MSVFSTSFGPSPGASVPMTSTGGVSSGKVSTLMRGVTTPAKTTSAMQIIRIAIGLASESLVMPARLARISLGLGGDLALDPGLDVERPGRGGLASYSRRR